MKKRIGVFVLALVGMAGLLLPLNAEASCGAGAVFFAAYYSPITGTANTSSLRSSFWMMGAGNVLTGAGIDNGPQAESGVWIKPYGPQPVTIASGWGVETTYDGCPDTLGASSSMAYALSDVDGGGNMIYAVGCASRNTQAFFEYEFSQPAGCTAGCSPIAMVPAPKANITGTTRSGTQANITVGSPNFAPGFYGDGSPGCALAAVIPQYEVYKQEVPRNGAAPGSRDANTGWVSVGTQNIGSPFSFLTACVSDCDVYVSILPAYNSGFKTGEPATGGANRVGANGTKVQAGPILANPPKPRISNPKKTQ